MTDPNRPAAAQRGGEAMSKPLSPLAQAVLDAYGHEVGGIAAVLRAMADHQQAPITLGQPIDHWNPDDRTRRELRNLAAELEAANA